MSLTLEEIKERLLHLYDPDDLIESLNITSEDLLDRFEDKLLKNIRRFSRRTGGSNMSIDNATPEEWDHSKQTVTGKLYHPEDYQ